MKIYLSGPMRGMPDLNYPAFFKAADRIRSSGHDVFNPAAEDILAGVAVPTLAGYMSRDLAVVCQCEAVAVLPGWEKSEGANIEVWVARKLGLKILDANTLEEIPERAVETKPTNAKDRAATHRLDISLFPMSAIAYGALGMTEGDCKYGGFNYRPGGVLASIYVAALLRHLFRWYNGQNVDPVTRVPHLASMISCVAILIDALECGTLVDDRPPSVDLESLLKRSEEIVKHLHAMYPNGPERYTEKGLKQ